MLSLCECVYLDVLAVASQLITLLLLIICKGRQRCSSFIVLKDFLQLAKYLITLICLMGNKVGVNCETTAAKHPRSPDIYNNGVGQY